MPMNKKKKILYVITKSVWGGAQKYVFDLATHLPRNRFSTVVALGGCGPLYQKLQKEGIAPCEVKNFQKSINPLKDLFAFFELFHIMWIFKPDVIHTNSSKAGGIASAAAKLYAISTNRNAKTIFTAHGWAFHEDRPHWQLVLIRLASRLTATFHDAVICLSKYDTESAAKKNIAGAHKIQTIQNGVSATTFLPREEAQKELFASAQSLVIGTIAEWTHNKGLLYLLEALPAIRERFSHVKLCLIGWGEQEKDLRCKIHDLRIEQNVFLLSRSPASPYLKAFDIFALPSLKEGLPYTLLEAGLAGIPVVATRVGGVPDIIEHEKNGFLVTPASPKELTGALLRLCSNPPLRTRLGALLQETVKEKFSLDTMMQKTLTVYDEPAGA